MQWPFLEFRWSFVIRQTVGRIGIRLTACVYFSSNIFIQLVEVWKHKYRKLSWYTSESSSAQYRLLKVNQTFNASLFMGDSHSYLTNGSSGQAMVLCNFQWRVVLFLINCVVRAIIACSRYGMGFVWIFSLFSFCPLIYLICPFFDPSPSETEIMSQKAVKPKTAIQPTNAFD